MIGTTNARTLETTNVLEDRVAFTRTLSIGMEEMTLVWELFEGTTIAGYDLEEWLGGSCFSTKFSEQPAIIQLAQGDRHGEEQLALWRRASRLDHPNLQRIIDAGRDDELVYAVFERPEERLDDALRSSALTAEQRAEVRAAVAEALAYIHRQGFVHTAVGVAHVVAVRDAIKLTSDTLREADIAWTPAEDRRALAAMFEEPARAARIIGLQWKLGAVAAVALGILFVLLRHPAPPPAAAAAPPRVAAAPAPAPVAVPPAPVGHWRVVVYTFARYVDAERKAESINRGRPDFHAAVFAPHGPEREPFFVSLGGRMTRADAERLRERAIAAGMPRDTFARNFSE
jgi:hypothetical protein